MSFDPTYEPREGLTHRDADWSDIDVLVVGLGVSGFAAADALAERGARVTAVSRDVTEAISERATILEILDVDVRLGPEHVTAPPERHRARRHLSRGAAARPADARGRNERHTRVGRGRARLAHAGRRRAPRPGSRSPAPTARRRRSACSPRSCAPAGCARRAPATSARRCSRRCCTPSPTTCWPSSCRASSCTGSARCSAVASAVLNVAPDHLDWHGDYAEYLRAKGRSTTTPTSPASTTSPTCRPSSSSWTPSVVEGCRADRLHDRHPGTLDGRRRRGRARRPGLRRAAAALGRRAVHPRRPAGRRAHRRLRTTSPTPWPRPRSPGPTASGRSPCATGCARSAPTGTASPRSRRCAGCASSTTPRRPTRTPRRPRSAPSTRVVWIAGGLLKGADVDSLVEEMASRLRGVVLIGADRAQIAAGPRPTRAGCPHHRPARHRHWGHGPCRDAGSTARPARRRRAARPGRGLDGHVHQLRCPRRRLRGGGPEARARPQEERSERDDRAAADVVTDRGGHATAHRRTSRPGRSSASSSRR